VQPREISLQAVLFRCVPLWAVLLKAMPLWAVLLEAVLLEAVMTQRASVLNRFSERERMVWHVAHHDDLVAKVAGAATVC